MWILLAHFKPQKWKRKEKKILTKAVKEQVNTKQRAKQEQTSSQGYHFMNTTFLDLRMHGYVPKGYIKSFMVILDNPLSREDVENRIEEAFGKKE